MNIELANLVLKNIRANPEAWNQDVWLEQKPECSTAGCFAGWTVKLARPDAEPVWQEPYDDYGTMKVADFIRVDGETRGISTVAMELLGLTFEQAEYLFQFDNSLSDLKFLVQQCSAGDESDDT